MKISCFIAVVLVLHVLQAHSYGSRYGGRSISRSKPKFSSQPKEHSSSFSRFRDDKQDRRTNDKSSRKTRGHRHRRSVDSFNTVLDATRQTVQNFGNAAQEQFAIANDVIHVVEQNVAQTFTDVANAKLDKSSKIFNTISSGIHDLLGIEEVTLVEGEDVDVEDEDVMEAEGADAVEGEGEDGAEVEGEEVAEVEDNSEESDDSLSEREDSNFVAEENDGTFNAVIQAARDTVRNIGDLTQEQIHIGHTTITTVGQNVVGGITDLVTKRINVKGIVVNQAANAGSMINEEIQNLFSDDDTLIEVNDTEEMEDNEIPTDVSE